MELTQDQINEVEVFQQSLSAAGEWYFYHLAWATGPTYTITYADRYDIMQRWDKLMGDKDEA